MNDIDYDKLWGEIEKIVEEECTSPKKDFEYTKYELQAKWRVSRTEATKMIEELVASGKLKSRKAKVRNGARVTVYFPAQ